MVQVWKKIPARALGVRFFDRPVWGSDIDAWRSVTKLAHESDMTLTHSRWAPTKGDPALIGGGPMVV